jgi:hypothetical protein
LLIPPAAVAVGAALPFEDSPTRDLPSARVKKYLLSPN